MHGTGAPLGRFSREVPDEARAAARAVADVLARAQRVLVCGHTGADGDVAGSSLALAAALRERGQDVVVYNDRPYPAQFAWLPGGDGVVHALSKDARFDATVVVDAAEAARLGTSFPTPDRRGVFVWIDHHRNDAPPGDVNYVDLTAAAVGEQVVQVLDALGHPVSRDVARCVYASLLSDTGGFRYGNTSSRAFLLAARLVDAGVEPWEMTQRIYESQAAEKIRLLGRALGKLWISRCGRLGVVDVDAADLRDTGADDEHAQGLVNHVRGIQGVEVAVLVRPASDGVGSEIVLRGKGAVDVAPIAARLGARGTRNAAKVLVPDDVARAKDRVIEAALVEIDPAEASRVAAEAAIAAARAAAPASRRRPAASEKRPRRAGDRAR